MDVEEYPFDDERPEDDDEALARITEEYHREYAAAWDEPARLSLDVYYPPQRHD